MTGLSLALLATACGNGGSSELGDPGAPLIVATTSIWADVVANIVCDDTAVVEALIPIGADPHGFEPSLADRGRMETAELVVANGLALEESLDDTLESVEAAGTAVLRMAEHVEPIGDDPHVWFDPIRVSGALSALAGRLFADVDLDTSSINGCLSTYQEELVRVDAEIADLLASVPREHRKLVTNHDSLGYFADRYGLEVIGTVIPASSTLAETSPAALEELAQVIEDSGVTAIFAEAQTGTDDAEALADRIGDIEVITLPSGSLGKPGGGADTYIGLLRTTARLVAEGLG